MSKIYDRLFFAGPMKMGDYFAANGIIHHYADRCDELHLPVWPHIVETVKTLHKDWPNIKVVSLCAGDSGENQYVAENRLSRINRVPMHFIEINGAHAAAFWDHQMYQFYELPFHMRYTNFRLPKHIQGSRELYQRLSGGEPYGLLHCKGGDHNNLLQFNIDLDTFRKANGFPDLKFIEVTPDITNDMMQYVDLIRNAQEIHCVPSSFFCMVDSLYNQTNAILFYHDVRAETVMQINSQWNNNRWNIVKYATKL